MTLYNCRTTPFGHRISKFDGDLNLEATYEIVEEDCSCPSRLRPCKHIPMVQNFIARGYVNTSFFLTPAGFREFHFEGEGPEPSTFAAQSPASPSANQPRAK